MSLILEQLVSNESIQQFKIYKELLREWNRSISLVQEDTIAEFEFRHIIDSLQIIPIIKSIYSFNNNHNECLDMHGQENMAVLGHSFEHPLISKVPFDDFSNAAKQLSIIDVGTGAGFPGMVLAMCGFPNVTLCDSNQKKCLFLSEVARQTDTKVVITNDRVEKLADKYDLIVSRAFTDLNGLCLMMSALAASDVSCGIFHKGRNWQSELNLAKKNWSFSSRAFRSATSDESVLMLIQYLVSTNS